MRLTVVLCALLGASFIACGSADKAIAEGDLDAICKKVAKLSPEEDGAEGECKGKLGGLKAKDAELFKKVAKCVSEATDEASMKYCNDKDNPRYK